ncbi:hypothetical protein D9619_003519 [Psilocybe cf. subviscida]|uniref:F-box domain-containing protein n=1 Tax=Psilocybe cf. subviscida TaxID=2480587 RepID=A0A8H5AY88_9AGAR|nr:hypothetical protein D9619_003519 [Psilocybe cf. subviscida]
MRRIDEEREHELSLTQQRKFERNAESRICQLPTEILCHIFLLTRRAYESTGDTKPSPHKGLPSPYLWIFATTHVCRHWRAVALNEPALWTCPALFLPNLGRLMLERSRMAGLIIEIDHRKIEPDLMDVVLQHMPHTKKFNILNGFPLGLKKLFSQLPSAAPMLEDLIIRYEADPYGFFEGARARVLSMVPTSLFREVTSLRALTVKGLGIQDWNSPLFDHLTSLCLDDIGLDRRPSAEQFRAMLARMPQLTELLLGNACPSSEGSQEPIYLPNLRTLSIGTDAPQVTAFYSLVATPPELASIKTLLLYRPEINFIDMFSTAKRTHLLDTSSVDGLRLGISHPQGGIAFEVTKDTDLLDDDEDDEDDDESSARILIKSSWIHYSSTRESTAHQHMYMGVMTGLDWTYLQTLSIKFDHLTPEILLSSIGFLPNLTGVVLHGKVAVPFIKALHSGWDVDPEIQPVSLTFPRLVTISFLQVEFSFDKEDADKDSLELDLLQDCLMGRCERGAAIELVMIMLCEGICEDDVDKLSDIVSSLSWDGEEIGFDSDDESSGSGQS